MKQFPYLLEVQSNLFEDANRAVYIPLVSEHTLKKPDEILNAALTIAGCSVVVSTRHFIRTAKRYGKAGG